LPYARTFRFTTPDGFVVDLTWTGGPKRPELGREYFGVPFKTGFVAMQALKYHAVVPLLDDWEHDWPLWKSCPPTGAFLKLLPPPRRGQPKTSGHR
jgi:hypothetical protein